MKTLEEFKDMAKSYGFSGYGSIRSRVVMSKMFISIYELLLEILHSKDKKPSNDGWIKITDELPEVEKRVLVAYDLDSLENNTEYDVFVGHIDSTGNFRNDAEWFFAIDDVEYWMPLPEMPR